MYTILLVAHTIIVLFLIVLVLIQRSSSDGLGGLGGGGGNQFLTGRASANLLTRTTAILAGAFMCTSLILGIMASHMTEGSIIDATPVEQTAPSLDLPPAAPAKKETPAVPKPE